MILVTGAAGEVGRRVADLLAGGDTPVRLVSRDPARVTPRAAAREMTGQAPLNVEGYFARHPGHLTPLRGVAP